MIHRAFALTLAFAAATASCGRRSEYIGRVAGGGAGDASSDQSGSGGSAGNDAVAPGDGPGGMPAACTGQDPSSLVLVRPAWNCNGGVRCFSEPDLPLDPAVFQGAPVDPDPTRQPVIVYPLPGSLHPMNLARITLQWKRAVGAGQSAFRITITPDGLTPYQLYVRHHAPSGPTPAGETDAIFDVPETVWRWIAQESAGRIATITVAARDVSGVVATSAPVSISFSPSPLEAGLHYLSTEIAAGINRHVFGARASHLLVPNSGTPGPTDCLGCHSPSRDGSTLGFAASYAGSLTLVRTGNVAQPLIGPLGPPNEANGISPAVSPDGQLVLAREGVTDVLTIYSAATAKPLSTASPMEMDGRIDYPEWSPSGQEIVATRAQGPQPAGEYAADNGEVVIIPVAGTPPRLQAPVVIARELGQVHAHPSWSPDGNWVVFVSSPAGMSSHRNAQTNLRLVRRSGGAIYTLDNASRGPGNASTYPKFAPIGQRGCQLLFIAFHSRLDYGVVRARLADPQWPQLWLSAIDLSRLPGDPSTAPVWLPFQDVRNKNLLPAWSEKVPCDNDAACGPGARCATGGACVATPQ